MPAATLARFILIEARRGGLPWLAVAVLAVCLGLAAFLSQVALTEREQLQLAVVAATLRAAAVFLVCAYVVSSTLREMNDKALELMLSLPLSRTTQYLGRLAGFATAAAVLAGAFSLPLLLWAPASGVALWGASLALEAALMAAVALFFAMSLAQIVPAIAATLGLYLLARAIGAIRAIAQGPLAEASFANEFARWGVTAVGWLLPPLDAVTRTEWLLYGAPGASALATALAGLALYGALVTAAGLFDFHRRNL
jgi:ABC-type transport system involved in multi-copper enzyme maturation permease subunit